LCRGDKNSVSYGLCERTGQSIRLTETNGRQIRQTKFRVVHKQRERGEKVERTKKSAILKCNGQKIKPNINQNNSQNL